VVQQFFYYQKKNMSDPISNKGFEVL